MAFTDEQLQQLKKECREITPVWSVTPELILDLLARLEAAEKIAEAMADEHEGCSPEGCFIVKFIHEWKKASGKEPKA